MARKVRSDFAAWYPLVISLLSVLLIVSLGYLVYSNRDLWSKGTADESFDNYATGSARPYVLYLFLMDGCGWCDRFKPEVAVLQNATQDPDFGKNVEVRIVSSPADDDAEQLARDFSVQSFPSIILSTRDQSKFWVYHASSDRTSAAIQQWAVGLIAQA